MKDRPPRALVPMDQRVGRAGSWTADAQPSSNRLDERGLPGTEISLEAEHFTGTEPAAEGFALCLELRQGQGPVHAWRRSRAGARRTSGAPAALSSFN